MKSGRMAAVLMMVFLALRAFGAENSADKVKRLLGEMKSDDGQLAQVATLELAGLGEAGLSAIDEILQTPGDHDKDWEAYKEVLVKVRKSTPITIQRDNAKAAEIVEEATRQAGLAFQWPTVGAGNQMARRDMSLEALETPFWELMETIDRRLNMRPWTRSALEIKMESVSHNPPGSKLCGDWVYVEALKRDYKVDYSKPGGSETNLTILMASLPDPRRFGLLHKGEVRIDQATDDAGVKYVQYITEEQKRSMPGRRLQIPSTAMAALTSTGKAGKTLSMRGAFIHYGGEIVLVKEDIKTLEGKTVDVGAGLATVTKAAGDGSTLNLVFSKKDWRIKNVEPATFVMQALFQQYIWVEDQAGNKGIFKTSGMGGSGEYCDVTLSLPTEAPGRPAFVPATVVFAFPKEIKPISIPFEIRDIPLP